MFLQSIILAFVLLTGAIEATSSFNVFNYYNSTLVQDWLDISADCANALNYTVQCDPGTAAMAAAGPDSNYWTSSNISALCTSTCQSSLSSWLSSVETNCGTTFINLYGTPMEPKTLPLSYTYGYDVVCLTDSSGNNCFYDSQFWSGRGYTSYSVYACYDPNVGPTIPGCSDINSTYFNPAQIMEDRFEDMTLLYNSSMYCDECFLGLWRQRLLNPLLAPGEWTDYLVQQYDNLQTNCSVDMPVTTSSQTLYSTTTTSPPTATPTANSTNCVGQIVAPSDLTWMTCNDISDTYQVSTGMVMRITGDYACQFNTSICLPPPCTLDTITDYGISCQSLVDQYSTTDSPVTVQMLLAWNPNLMGDCGSLSYLQRICVAPPGGLAFPSSTPVIYAPTSTYYSTATAAEPTQTGSVANCGLYYNVVTGDTCNSIALRFGTTFAALQTLNSYLNSDCTNLWLDYAICVAPVTAPSVSTDGTCGPSNGDTTCTGSGFGDCCSVYGYCGSTDDYCAPGNCVSGACIIVTATTDGTCGPDNGYTTCTNPDFGYCCSIYGYCGSSVDYCAAGNCYSGSCDTDDGGPSTNGECGPLFAGNKVCDGTQFGSCCSVYGYCGDGDDYCSEDNCYSGACDTS